MRAERLTLEGLWAFLERKSAPLAPGAYSQLVAEVLAGDAYVVCDASGPFAIGGVQQAPGQDGVAWFSATAARMAGRPRAVIEAMVSVLGAYRGDGQVCAYVDRDNAQGHKLARLAGFVPSGRAALGLVEYRWGSMYGRCGRAVDWRRRAAPRAGDGGCCGGAARGGAGGSGQAIGR